MIFQAEILTGMKVNSESECENALLKLLDSSCSKVIITLGSKGAICAESEARKPIMVKSKQVKAVDTTVSQLFFFEVSCLWCQRLYLQSLDWPSL